MTTPSVTGLLIIAALGLGVSHPIAQQVSTEAQSDLASQVQRYRRFSLPNPYKSLVNDRGRGYDGLNGVRNMRVVLHGVYYRGGANNAYAVGHVRDNQNPLQDWALEQLCAEGFTDVVYLYVTNFTTAKRTLRCSDSSGAQVDLSYTSVAINRGPKQRQATSERRLLTMIHEHVSGVKRGPLSIHCWNGWHASGLVAALALRQFCGWSPAQAEKYFIDTATPADREPAAFAHLKLRIREFTPYTDLPVSPPDRALLCPAATVP